MYVSHMFVRGGHYVTEFFINLFQGGTLTPPFYFLGPSPLQVPALLPTQPVAVPVHGPRGQECRNLQGRRTKISLGVLKCTYFYLAILKFTTIFEQLHIGMVSPNVCNHCNVRYTAVLYFKFARSTLEMLHNQYNTLHNISSDIRFDQTLKERCSTLKNVNLYAKSIRSIKDHSSKLLIFLQFLVQIGYLFNL